MLPCDQATISLAASAERLGGVGWGAPANEQNGVGSAGMVVSTTTLPGWSLAGALDGRLLASRICFGVMPSPIRCFGVSPGNLGALMWHTAASAASLSAAHGMH